MWIVMSARVIMPEYKKIALVHVSERYAREGRVPRMISKRARGVEAPADGSDPIIELGNFYAGPGQLAYDQGLARAHRLARQLNGEASGIGANDGGTNHPYHPDAARSRASA